MFFCARRFQPILFGVCLLLSPVAVRAATPATSFADAVAAPPRKDAPAPSAAERIRRFRTLAEQMGAAEARAAREAFGRAAFAGDRVPDPALALARLSAEQFMILYGDGRRSISFRADALTDELARALDAHRDGFDPILYHSAADRDAGFRRTGTLEGAYVSPVDSSVQPYRYYVPAGLREGDGPVSLVVLLHGYVPSYNKADWVDLDPTLTDAVEREGAILLVPFGRGNTDFLSVGEVDVLAAVAEIRKRYPVDDRRIHLAGYSMGGSGVWTLLAHFPDRWASARIWSGRNDWFHWHEDKLAALGLDRDNFPPNKRPLVLADNPYDLFETLTDVPIDVVHPLDDYMVQPTQASRIARLLAPPAGRLALRQPERGGHFSVFYDWRRPEVWAALPEQMAAVDPETVEHVTFTPKYGAKHWLAITETVRPDLRARLKVRRDEAGRTYVVEAHENVARFRIIPGRRPWSPGPVPEGTEADWGLRLAEGVEGVLAARGLPPEDRFGAWEGQFGVEAPQAPDADPAKRATGESATFGLTGVFGPVKEAFNESFALVLGLDEKGNPRHPADLDRAAQFFSDWNTFAHAEVQFVSDEALLKGLEAAKGTPAETGWRRNYVLIGTPESNRYLARLAPKLPFHYPARDGLFYRVGEAGADPESGGPLGLLGIYPNPEMPDRYVVVLDGLYYGEKQSFNHKWDLAPDFIVFGREIDDADGNNRARRSGFFDNAWRVDPELTWRHDPPESAPARPDDTSVATP